MKNKNQAWTILKRHPWKPKISENFHGQLFFSNFISKQKCPADVVKLCKQKNHPWNFFPAREQIQKYWVTREKRPWTFSKISPVIFFLPVNISQKTAREAKFSTWTFSKPKCSQVSFRFTGKKKTLMVSNQSQWKWPAGLETRRCRWKSNLPTYQ